MVTIFSRQVVVHKRTLDRDSICGGTILDEETILSAAHCFDPQSAQIKANKLISHISER